VSGSGSTMPTVSELGGPRALSAQLGETLAPEEQRRIAVRMTAHLAGAGLLTLGWLVAVLDPSSARVGEMMQAVAGITVAAPVVVRGVRGLLSQPPRDFTDQLVAIAVAACLAQGDFVTATLVPLFLELGHLFEERSVQGARAAVDAIRRLSAASACRVVDGAESWVLPAELAVGDRVRVRPGEVFPADGRVIRGHAAVDQAPVTGESGFDEVAPGDTVFEGTLDLDGLLEVEVTAAGQGTVMGKVVEVLREVEASKTPTIRLLERFAGAYLPVVLAVAAVTLFLTGSMDRAIAVLIVACPCALVLAGPAAMVASMARAGSDGVLIKRASFLEQMASVDTVLLDKTGTLTTGVATLHALEPAHGVSEDELLLQAARCGAGSGHPVSRAVVRAAKERGLEVDAVDEARERRGRGVAARVEGTLLRLGRASWLREEGVVVPQAEGSAVGPSVWVAQDDRLLGRVVLRDPARKEAGAALAALRARGIDRVVLVTGDKAEAAAMIARELGMDEVFAEVLPVEKLEVVRAEQAAGRTVLMVGDGVNDAPALGAADVGVAIGARVSDVALGGSDIAILGADLGALPRSLDLARRTRRIVAENAVGGLALSVGLLALASTGVIGALTGAVLHNLGAVYVVLNSTRLLARERNLIGS
jgi:Zn2+/Cd2+-exporting ATPase